MKKYQVSFAWGTWRHFIWVYMIQIGPKYIRRKKNYHLAVSCSGYLSEKSWQDPLRNRMLASPVTRDGPWESNGCSWRVNSDWRLRVVMLGMTSAASPTNHIWPCLPKKTGCWQVFPTQEKWTGPDKFHRLHRKIPLLVKAIRCELLFTDNFRGSREAL